MTRTLQNLLLQVVLALTVFGALAGCTPYDYRLRADRETYGILAQKSQNPLWATPPFSVVPSSASRNFDPFNPDCPPMPPDDPAAHDYMHCADGKRGYKHWHRNGDALSIESWAWLECLQVSDDGVVQLDSQRAVELGILNSREYQLALEDLYLVSLALTLQRFEFDAQWSGLTETFGRHFGTSSIDDPLTDDIEGNESNRLRTTSTLGVTRAFPAGGQLLVDFANTFLWEFAGVNTNSTSSNLFFRFSQPLLRKAARDVRMEGLTQAERDVLYAIRDFARFRKQFYFDLVSGNGGYLSLLLQLQSIRNLESNLVSLEQNLIAHESLSEAGIVSPLQVDQVFQNYQAGKLRLIRAQNDLQSSQDSYKIGMGLPPELEVQLDDSLLKPFEFNSPELTELQSQVDQLVVSFRELDEAPPLEELGEGFEQLLEMHDKALDELEYVVTELGAWKVDRTDEGNEVLDPDQLERERASRAQIQQRLSELSVDMTQTGEDIRETAEAIEGQQPEIAWEQIKKLARLESSHVADVFLLQTQIRTNLIELQPIEFEQQEAIDFALANRLDLMNQRAAVVDQWRLIKVAQDALEANLDVIVEGDLNTNPDSKNPLDFSAKDSSFRAGVRLDGPINRTAERNLYRAQLINYQQSRRDFIARRDDIVQDVRLDIRELEANRLNFEITRQSLITAARQVELARVELLAPGQAGDSSTTQDVLRALDTLLASKNALISIWVSYETNRLQLELDTEALQLNEQGIDSMMNSSTEPTTLEFETAPTTPDNSTAPTPPDNSTAPMTPDDSVGPTTPDSSTLPITPDNSTAPTSPDNSTRPPNPLRSNGPNTNFERSNQNPRRRANQQQQGRRANRPHDDA